MRRRAIRHGASETEGAKAIEAQKYLAELEKLLGFMSSWDRKAVVRRYETMFLLARDKQELIEELGTPTKIAVDLARDYVPSPAPQEASAGSPEPSPPSSWPEPLVSPAVPAGTAAEAPPSVSEWFGQSGQPLSARAEQAVEPAPEAELPPEKKGRPLGKLLFWLFFLIVGLPVALIMICIGVPFLASGAAALAFLISAIPAGLASFHLLSDVLLVTGVGLMLAALALLLVWFGLWLSLVLCRLWLEKAVLNLKKLAYPDP